MASVRVTLEHYSNEFLGQGGCTTANSVTLAVGESR